jgi:hypothetical protein
LAAASRIRPAVLSIQGAGVIPVAATAN